MQDLGWKRRWGSCPAARRGARLCAGLMPASASNKLSCLLEMLHSKQLRSIKMLIDSNHGIYRGENPALGKDVHGELDFRRLAPQRTTRASPCFRVRRHR